jgi:hypothetical protein
MTDPNTDPEIDPDTQHILAGIWRRMQGGKVVHMLADDIVTLFELHKQGKINLPVDLQVKLRNAIVVEGGKH